jgi:phosphoglycolate phosphatase-like HAD superfamily hydrolase
MHTNKKHNDAIYALDFDGVICDSAIETAMTGWKAAQTLWQDMPNGNPSDVLINNFRLIRPFLETGYEAILIVRLLQQGVTVEQLHKNYQLELQTLIQDSQLETKQLKPLFGTTRDQWIDQSPQEWLTLNPLFSGVLQALKTLTYRRWYIITTKQKRFVQQILKHHQISLDEQFIYGMEVKMSKQDTLLKLSMQHPHQDIIFIEDRLPTLINISNNQHLNKLTLQLVDWGYNTQDDQQNARLYPIECIGINQFIA